MAKQNAKKGTTTKRTTSSKKTSGKKISEEKKSGNGSAGKDAPEKETFLMGFSMRSEIELVAACGIMIILMLSNFGGCGIVGRWLSSFLFGIFGVVEYVLPIALFLMVALLLANDYSALAIKKCVAGFVALLVISAFTQILVRPDVRAFYELFSVAATDHRAGGVLGGGLGLLLFRAFGLVGAVVILCCILFLALIMLTQRSFVGFFRNCLEKGSAFFDSLKERNRQERQRQKEEQEDSEGKAQSELRAFGEAGAAGVRKEKTDRRRRSFRSDRERARACESKLKEMEKEKTDAGKSSRTDSDVRIHVPRFTSSEDIKPKDSVRELHPGMYPLTAEEGKTKAFRGELDYTALSFSSGKTPEEFAEEIEKLNVHKHEVGIGRAMPEELVYPGEKEEPASAFTEDIEAIVTGVESDAPAAEVIDAGSEDVIPEAAPDLCDSEEDSDLFVPEEEPDLFVSEETKDAAADKKKQVAGNSKRSPAESKKGAAAAAAAARVPTREKASGDSYLFPPVSLLTAGTGKRSSDQDRRLKETAMKLKTTLESFGVNVTITDISRGPTVTRYEMFPEQGTKVSKIVSLTDDIKLNLATSDIRIEAPIPGKAAVGIEVPNEQNETVHFRDLVDNATFRNFPSKLAFAVGKDIGGNNIIFDLGKMPHLLIAGATGSGKSVCINTLIMSILYKARPSEVKLIMIDPKMVELSTYRGIPHLLIDVVTDLKKASGALNWAVAEMTNRYKTFADCNVRNIEGYNKKVKELTQSGQVEEGDLTPMPQIVIIIDELADLMMVAPGEVEDAIVRLSQLARAAGLHLVIATQRPSVNVITGLIKANVPSRIAFAVSSGVDSRTIIDMNGAEKLLGKGDMLFYPSGYQKPVRVQGALVSDGEVSKVVEFLKENEDVAVYSSDVTEKIENKIKNGSLTGERDEYFEAAARFIMEKDKATIGMLQRMFKIGFNRAARIIDQLAEAGIVGPEEGTKPRKILMSPEQLDAYLEEN